MDEVIIQRITATEEGRKGKGNGSPRPGPIQGSPNSVTNMTLEELLLKSD